MLAARSKLGFASVVADQDGRIAGSNFMDVRSVIGGIGPISVDYELQNASIGRGMMQWAIDYYHEHGMAGVRLTQAGYHMRSLALYAKMGFVVREHLSVMGGTPLSLSMPSYAVRPVTEADIEACRRVCFDVHGFDRSGELSDNIDAGSAAAMLVERDGRVTGYTSNARYGHSVGETNEDLKALIGAISQVPGFGFLLPSRNGELLRWCLDRGLQITRPMTLMSMGLYNEPAGAALPSYLF